MFEHFIGLISVVAVFSIPLTAIITSHMRKKDLIRLKYIDKEIQLEQLKLSNYERETEKLRLELEHSKQLLLEDKKEA